MIHRRLVPAVALILFAGCTGEGPLVTEPDQLPQASNVAAATADISGLWIWTREEHLTFPDWVAQPIFGVQPEGHTTIAQCVVQGELIVAQSATSITGTYGGTSSACMTKGGQTFSLPLGPPEPISGRVTGKSVRFEIDGLMVDCIHHAVITDSQGSQASGLRGGGRCIVPGHPKSDVPGFNPPPAGTEVFTSWIATRP